MSRKTACEAGSLPAGSAACIPSHECGGLTPRFDNEVSTLPWLLRSPMEMREQMSDTL